MTHNIQGTVLSDAEERPKKENIKGPGLDN